ncbi:hypothetical protein BASA83_007891 [Batrachochytrium salamandrivorans]|nr:hypothetical protein BASA83_007891 [Batrachochytrium salamandrivorans]
MAQLLLNSTVSAAVELMWAASRPRQHSSDYSYLCKDAEGWGPWTLSRTLDFTPCYENIFIESVPKVLLIAFGAPRLWKLVSRPAFVAPVGFSYTAKLGSCILLAVLALISLAVLQSDRSHPAPPYISFSVGSSSVIYLLAAALHHYEHFYSRLSSSILLFFWLGSIIAHGIVLRTSILLDIQTTRPLYFSFVVSSLVLSLFVFIVENLPKPQSYYLSLDDISNASPEATANIFSRLTFQWMDQLMRLGYTKDLDMDDLWNLKKTDTSNYNSETFQKAWTKQLSKKSPSLLRAVASAFGPVFLSSAIFKGCQDILGFIQPQFLRQMMEFASSYSPESNMPPVPINRGFIIAFCMLGIALLQTVLLHQYFHVCLITGMRIRSSIVTAIYRKSLRLSCKSRQGATNGEISNLMAVDASRLADLCTYLHMLWSGPFQIAMAIYFLYDTLGPSIFGGVAIMVLMVPINGYLATKSRALGKTQMSNKDARTKLMDELLNGIKVIKLYAWENSFLRKIFKVREAELDTLKYIGYLSAAQSFTWSCTPFLVSFTSFALFSYFSEEPLTSTRVFVALSLFNLLQFPLSIFPSMISATVEASISFSRLYQFLMNEELDESAVTYELVPPFVDQSDIERVSIQQGNFTWLVENENTLNDISLSVRDAHLVAVVGTVGSGKSSLISAILGEMYKTSGSVTVRGSIAYVPQTAWIMNTTLRDNILFGRHYDDKLYNDTIDACGLRADLEILPAGDDTEIGERGINLSGGQKQRISIARAVYSDSDIYLFDDALSAVDAHVGRHIFDHVIGKQGVLKNKARVFVTHGVHLLSETDKVVQIMRGRIAAIEYGKRKASTESKDEEAAFAAAQSVVGSVDKTSHMPKRNSLNGGAVAPPVVGVANTTAAPLVDSHDKPKEKDALDGKSGGAVGAQIMTTELSAKGSVEWSVYMAYAKSCHIPAVIGFLLMAVLSQALMVFQNVYLSWWANSSDRAESYGVAIQSRHDVFGWLLGYGMIGIVSSISVVGQVIFVWVFCGIHAARILHDQMLNRVVRLPQSFFDTTPLGRILNRFSKDQYTIDEVLPRTFQGYFRTMFSVASVLAVNVLGSPLFLLFAIPLGALYSYFQRFYLSTSRELKRLESISRSPVYAHFQETLNGVSSIRAYKQELRFIDTNEERLDYNQRAFYPSVSSNRWLAVRLEFIGALIVFGSALFSVVAIYFKSSITAGTIGLMLSYSLGVTQSLNWMVRQSCEIETNIVSVERIKEYVELEQEAPYEIPETAPPAEWPQQGKIEFKNYSTRYREGLGLVLKNISFSVKPHEKIGIVGRTGAGKSSLTLALFRLIEASEGSVMVDGINISQLGLFCLRSRLTIIPQDPVLFAETVRYNLDPFGTCSDTDLWASLESANLKEHIASLEGGLDFQIQQAGENFSVGQRQLICLARALLRKTNVLILDEATAAIDVGTDHIIQETIRREFHECTVLTIAHRINTVMDSDRILVLDQGHIAEFDSPQVLLKNKRSMFYSLAKEAGQTK